MLARPIAELKASRPLWLTSVLILGALSFLLAANSQFVAYSGTYADRDFMTYWSGGKAVSNGLDPYDVHFWYSLRDRFGSSWYAEPYSLYPLWTNALFVPFSLLDINLAAGVWLTLSQIFLVVSVFTLVKLSEPTAPFGWSVLVPVAMAFLSRWMAHVLFAGQLTAFLLFLLTSSLFLLRRGRPVLSGVLLAAVFLKPSPFVLFAPLYGIWLVSRRQWYVVAGWMFAGFCLFVTSWALQPGWISGWLQARAKTDQTYRSPTLWGLSFDLAGDEWPLLGLVVVVLVTLVSAWIVVTRHDVDETGAMSLALAGSLLITPYAWAYEHMLLLIPIIFLSYCSVRARLRFPFYLFMVTVLPWALLVVAYQRGLDTFSAFVPLIVMVALIVMVLRRRNHQSQSATERVPIATSSP